MMTMLRLCLLAGAIVWPMAPEAGTKELENAILAAMPWDEHTPDAEQRQNFARAIKNYWEDFESRVPRLSPIERDWLTRELASQGDRFKRATYSQEYSISLLNMRSDECVKYSNFIIDVLNDRERKEFEMYGWLKLINCYRDDDSIIFFLKQAVISVNDEDQPIQMIFSSIIQSRIVNLLALMAMIETMGWTHSEK